MKKTRLLKIAAAIITAAAVTAAPAAVFAANSADTASLAANSADTSAQASVTESQMADRKGPMGGGAMGQGNTGNADSPSEIVTSTLTENSAEALEADRANAQTIIMSDENNSVKISEKGTYIVTGTCSNGNLAVKKGTEGVVLILKDLDLTSTTGAAVSLNKGTEVKVIIEGTVTLTDAEDIADEETDDFDGAALKAKAGSSVVLTGDGTLNVNGSCKNGIKVSDLEDDDKKDGLTEASFIIDGKDLTVNVIATGDGINSGTDLTIKSGTVKVSAGDDGIKADYILTIGEEGTDGPVINVIKSVEAIEGATINIYSGNIETTSSDDGINAANSDLTGYTYSLNIMGGNIKISSGADGIDSNGNINILGGLTTIVRSASNGGEGGLDYNGSCYIVEGTLDNPYGTTMDSGNGGMGGRGQRDWNNGSTTPPDGEMTGPNGGWPWQNGETPDSNGSWPWQNGETTGPNGGWPWQNGEMPDGQFPHERPDSENSDGGVPAPPDGKMRSDYPQSGNDAGNKAPEKSELPDTAEETQEPNWFMKIINAIKNWFASIFG